MRPILVLILLLPLPIAAAEADCRDWMESRFWKQAAAGDVRKCLDEGADITVRDGSGSTPMHLAARNGNAETVLALAEAGADPGARDEKGDTPMHLAAEQNAAETVKALAEAGSDPDARNENGDAPIHTAVIYSVRVKTHNYKLLLCNIRFFVFEF